MHKVGGEGSGAGHGISGGEEAHPLARRGPRGHGHRVAEHQEGAPRQGGVHKVLTQTAEELLYHHDGKEIADNQHPVGQRHRADKSQQHARDGGGQVPVGVGLM